jgi:NitT/TauT family transport system ATP-binding protein
MNAAATLEMNNATVVLGSGGTRHTVLDRVSLQVRPGEFVSLIGPSGCGKSTVLNVFAGFVRCAAGTATLDSRAITGPGPDRSVVFQQYSLFPWLNVQRNVEYGLRALGVSRRARRAKALKLLEHAGLAQYADRYPDQLSGGMKQRVGIIRAFATDPRVLLMDEPFSALDAQTRSTMQQLLTDIWEEHRISVLFVTHDIEEAVFLSDRVFVMSASPGRILRELSVALPRPRDADLVDTAAFLEHVHEIRVLVRREGLAGIGESPAGAAHGKDRPENLELERVLRALARRRGLAGIGASPAGATRSAALPEQSERLL